MDAQIVKLSLPRGKWQEAIKQALAPDVDRVECLYPDLHTLNVKCYKETAFHKDPKLVVQFSLSFLYGCWGILISHKMMVAPEFRHKGIAKKLQPIKRRIAKDLKVSALLTTVQRTNDIEKKVIGDWNKITSFKNIKTGHDIDVYFTELK